MVNATRKNAICRVSCSVLFSLTQLWSWEKSIKEEVDFPQMYGLPFKTYTQPQMLFRYETFELSVYLQELGGFYQFYP